MAHLVACGCVLRGTKPTSAASSVAPVHRGPFFLRPCSPPSDQEILVDSCTPSWLRGALILEARDSKMRAYERFTDWGGGIDGEHRHVVDRARVLFEHSGQRAL